MPIKLYNTLTRKKEPFKPLNPPRVGLYTCGPTVYGPGHLGHARSYTNFDLLKRVLLYNSFKVKHILNITDVHDDMIKRANERGISIFELADEYIPQFYADLEVLNIQPADVYPRVTEVIPEIIEMVKTLVDKGYAYVVEDGSVYYQVTKFSNYGCLSGVKLEEAVTGTRVETDKYEREAPTDFALWKAQKPGEPAWDSPWGRGRPGWHIECSVMAKKFLGETIDIHAGAMDLKFPHHENEIAQSEAANGVKFVNYWIHAGLLDVEGRKMSKSLGNIYTLEDLQERGFDPLAFRYLCLTTHYRSQLNFTWKSLEAAQKALGRLRREVARLRAIDIADKSATSEVNFGSRFKAAINDDLNMPQALAVVWEMISRQRAAGSGQQAVVYQTLLDFDRVLGLKLAEVKPVKIPTKVERLAKERENLRGEGKFAEADKIRKQIQKMGFTVEDTPEGPVARRKSLC